MANSKPKSSIESAAPTETKVELLELYFMVLPSVEAYSDLAKENLNEKSREMNKNVFFGDTWKLSLASQHRN